MARAEKLFEQMTRNPKGDFSMEDIQSVCRAFGIACEAPKRGSHFAISHPSQKSILTVPYNRPIKPVYIRLVVTYVRAVKASSDDGKA
ncbi:MAG: type II toxin-antitoxin system HicA family toxin [Pseudomonadota bacterium]